MATILSNGIDLDSLSPAEFAALVLAAKSAPKPARVSEPREPKPEARCVVSPHTGACTRCGSPAGANRCDTGLVSLSFVATLAMRAAR
jgi:hypothetical protein